jgi:hypothetical protein
MVADPTGVLIEGPSSGGGSGGIEYRFDQPVDLTNADLIRIIQTHSGGKNRISAIYLSLPNFERLELRNLGTSPFLDNQNQYALYNFESSFDSWVYLPKDISKITIEFDIRSSESILLEILSLETVGERVPLGIGIELGGTRDLTIKSSRQIQTGEIVRLEASFDLIHWFDKSNYSIGGGEIATFDKNFEDAQFYRLRWHQIVEPVD